MLYNVSYRNKEVEEEIDDLIGKRFGLLDRLKMKGIGSQRFVVENSNVELMQILQSQTGSPLCNIELRTKGLAIWFRVKIHNYVLVFPFRNLVVYKSQNQLSLYNSDWKIKLLPAHNRTLKLSFIRKILSLKNSLTQAYSPI